MNVRMFCDIRPVEPAGFVILAETLARRRPMVRCSIYICPRQDGPFLTSPGRVTLVGAMTLEYHQNPRASCTAEQQNAANPNGAILIKNFDARCNISREASTELTKRRHFRPGNKLMELGSVYP
jgi:hypothetical protein